MITQLVNLSARSGLGARPAVQSLEITRRLGMDSEYKSSSLKFDTLVLLTRIRVLSNLHNTYLWVIHVSWNLGLTIVISAT